MRDLLEATAALVAVPSVSHDETALADHVMGRLAEMPWLEVDRIGDNVVARTVLGRSSRLVLAGHLDTVPANGNAVPRIRHDTLWGLGAADMKAGLAVMLELAGAVPEPAVDLTFAFYVAEEVARADNGLLAIAEVRPDLLAGDAAVLGEPTSAHIEAGCQGVVNLEVTLGGRRAHTARPWRGLNAVHRLAPVLEAVASYDGRRPDIGGCRYHEALQAVHVAGGVAANVVPGEATLRLNHRFAPDRDAAGADAALRALLEPLLVEGAGDRVRVLDVSPAAPPALDHPLLAALLEATGRRPQGKLGWTDVAFFAERGIPAVNFGPGDPELAHTAEERVAGAELESVLDALTTLVGGDSPPTSGAGG
ncbi:MAG: succinyl-diaminopimelate desuccinylase [Acidimicrobiales bacterium]